MDTIDYYNNNASEYYNQTIELGMEDIITDYFDPKVFLPAVGQGALGIECLKNFKHKDIFSFLGPPMWKFPG